MISLIGMIKAIIKDYNIDMDAPIDNPDPTLQFPPQRATGRVPRTYPAAPSVEPTQVLINFPHRPVWQPTITHAPAPAPQLVPAGPPMNGYWRMTAPMQSPPLPDEKN